MKKNFWKILVLTLAVVSCAISPDNPAREEILLDMDWKFMRSDVDNAQSVNFDDSSWRTLNLPHDYSIEDLPGTDSPFNPEAISGVDGGFTTGGTAWYRKTFNAPAEWKGKKLELLFEGVYMNADVWINGKHAGNNIYGYTPFNFDITEYLNIGGRNIIAVQVKNEGVSSRWYTGSGIYRHVWLKVLNPVHITENGIYITTPDITQERAVVNIETNVINKNTRDETVNITTEIIDLKGNTVAVTKNKQTLKSGDSYTFSQELPVDKPAFWSPDSPSLYSVRTTLVSKSGIDRKTTTFGIRTITMDAKNGFVINGVPMKLKGGCVHHDNGPLGSKAFDRAEERRVELLKASGFNAVRCAHNPPSVAFLEACDRLGMLVIDEIFDMWGKAKRPQDYHFYFNDDWQKALSAMILRDRNHPSIFLWSIGNEISDMHLSETAETSRKLVDFVRSLDPTRPVTAAANNLDGKLEGFFATLDVSGINYGIIDGRDYYPELAAKNPGIVMYGAESYALDAFDAWAAVEKYDYVTGDFVWTAIDYIGEASIGWHGYWQSPGFYPWNLAFDGDIDICGWKRPQSFYRDAFWNKDNITIAVHPPVLSFDAPQKNRESWSRWHYDDVVFDWNWEGYEGVPFTVDLYTSCDEAELFLNNKSLGRKTAGAQNKNKVTYRVPYETGELKAIGYQNGKTVEHKLNTSGQVSQIKLTADRNTIKANNQDLSYITIELQDSNGILNPKADNQLRFSIESGDATIVAVGNSNPVSTESYTLPTRKAWRGKCLVIVRAGESDETVVLKVSSAGLPDALVTVGGCR